jgi:hypothetical protein
MPQKQPDDDLEETLLDQGTGGPEDQADEALEDQPLTRAEFEAEWAAREAQLVSRVQSLTDQAESRTARRFAELQQHNARALEILKRAGGMTEPQLATYAEQLRQDALQRALQGDAPAEGEPPVSGAPPAQDEEAYQQAVTYEGLTLATQLGLAKGDPELALIDTTPGILPEEYKASIRAAAKAKQQRLQARPASAARIPSLGAGGRRAATPPPWKQTENVDELLDQEWDALRNQG